MQIQYKGAYPNTKKIEIVRQWSISTGESCHLNPNGDYCLPDGSICTDLEHLKLCIPPGHHRDLMLLWWEERFGASSRTAKYKEQKEKEKEESLYTRQKGAYKESKPHDWREWKDDFGGERPSWWGELEMAQIGATVYKRYHPDIKK